MKLIFVFTVLLFASSVYSQTPAKTAILNLSKKIFQFEVEGKLDSLADLLDEDLVIVNSGGVKKSKQEYMADLKAGKPVHNSIDVKEESATLFGQTAIVIGKGIFVFTINKVQATLSLSYMEVFAEENNGWKLMALHSSRLSN